MRRKEVNAIATMSVFASDSRIVSGGVAGKRGVFPAERACVRDANPLKTAKKDDFPDRLRSLLALPSIYLANWLFDFHLSFRGGTLCCCRPPGRIPARGNGEWFSELEKFLLFHDECHLIKSNWWQAGNSYTRSFTLSRCQIKKTR